MFAKVLFGIILFFAGLWLILPIASGLPLQGTAWNDFKVVLWGVLPPFLLFMGGLIVWIEMEDMKEK